MVTSRRIVHALIAAAALGTGLAACDSLIGLGKYSVVPCDADCSDTGSAVPDAGGDESDGTIGTNDSGSPDATDASDGGDASDAADVTVVDSAPEATPSDASFEASPVTLWARWPMPNPDAAVAPASDAMLPNQMSYQINDAGQPIVMDRVTLLVWYATPVPLPGSCPAGFHVPTRIQLVSLIDFTQSPVTINGQAFPGVTQDRFITSSQVIVDGGPNGQYWIVDFSTGLVATTGAAHYALCLQDGQ
jgi:hypothetical protein